MNPHSARRHRLAVAALGALAAATACTSITELEKGGDTRGIDAEAYLDDYESEVDATSSGVGALPQSAETGAAPPGGPYVEPGPLDDNTFVDAGTSGFVRAPRPWPAPGANSGDVP